MEMFGKCLCSCIFVVMSCLISIGAITITMERLPSGEIKFVAYPRQNGLSIVDHSSLSCSFSDSTYKSIYLREDGIISKLAGKSYS